MSRSDCLNEKHEQSTWLFVDNYDEDSAARTRPISYEEIMLRRRNKELLENVKDTTDEAWNISPGGSSEKIGDQFESEMIYKYGKRSSSGREKLSSENLVNVSSRKKLLSICVKEENITEGKDRTNYILETKSNAELNNIDRITKEKNGEEVPGLRKKQRMSDISECEAGNKHSRDSVNLDRYSEMDRSKSERKIKKKNHVGDDENPKEYHTERKHDKDRHVRGNPNEYHTERRHEKDRHDRGNPHDKDRHDRGNPNEYHTERKHDEDRHDRGNPNEYHTERKHDKDRHGRGRPNEYHTEREHDKDRHDRWNPSKYHTERKHEKDRHDRENPNEYHTERKHDKDRHDRGKTKKHLNNDSEEAAAMKHHRDSVDKDRHAEDRAKHEREIKRKYRRGDDQTQDRNTARKQDLLKHNNHGISETKERRETVKIHYEELTAKRRRSRSPEREDRRRSPSFSPSAPKQTFRDGEHKELSVLSLRDSSRKKHSDVDRSRVSTNGSSPHHPRHGGSTSRLGGYSPRKRKSEAAVKTPSPSKQSVEKKRAGWDLPPTVSDNPTPAFVSSNFQLSNFSVLSNIRDIAVDPAIVKPQPVSFLNDLSTVKNANIDSVQLTQATRPRRRLYLENLPASASEKDVIDCFNNLLLSAGINRIQQAEPCISCILHKDKGQALLEFLRAEDASAALTFDGSTLFGSIVKIRRPKDYVEVATCEPERSVDAALVISDSPVTISDATVVISDAVIDSPDKIFIGGISKHISSEMVMEIATAFGSLKAFHFETEDSSGPYAFVEYVDHSVTIKACAGLNGMKLGGEVLTVVQAMPDASPMENGGKPPSYRIPEHAKPLLRKPTQVLKLKNVCTVESISSLADMEIDEVLEDVRLECTRFGTIKSLNVVKDSSDKNLATKLEDIEVTNAVDSKEASGDTCVIDNAESRFSENTTSPNSKETNGVEFSYEKEVEEDKINDANEVNVDKNADEGYENESCQEQLVSDTAVDDTGNKSIPSGIIQECPSNQDGPKDGSELHDKMDDNNVGLDNENKMMDGIMDSNNTACTLEESFPELDANLGLVGPKKVIDEEDDSYNLVFEPGSVLVEFGRAEACYSAAHCLHGRFFDGRIVTVEYVPLHLYRERFPK